MSKPKRSRPPVPAFRDEDEERRDVRYQSLMKVFLAERIARERRQRRG